MKRSEKYPETNTFHYYNANPKNRFTTEKEFCEMLQKDVTAVGMSFIANIGGHHMVCIKETGGLHGSHKVHDIWNSTDGCIGNYWTKGYYGK